MTNVYRIGVSIAMANGVSPVLGIIAKDVLGLHGKVGQLSAGFSRLKLAIGGALSVAAGAAVLTGMLKVTDAAKDLSREQGKMYAAGLSNKEVAEATAHAWTMSANIMGMRVSENLSAIGHLRAAFGDLQEAQRIAPAYQRNSVALGVITGRDGEAENFKLARAIHMSGSAIDPATGKLSEALFAQKNNLYTAMIAAGGGKLDAGTLLTFQQNAGSYGGNLTDEGRINLVGAIQAMGGRTGTQLSSLNRALKDGVLQKSTLSSLEGIGLIDPRMVKTAAGNGAHGNGGSPGGGMQLLPGALANEAQFRADPAGWVWNTLIPKLQAAGMKTSADQVNWIQHAKLTTNPTRLLSELIRNQPVDRTEAANVRKAAGADQYRSVMGADVDANEKALHAAFKDMMTAFGAPLVKPAITAMQSITGAVKGITAWASVHPQTVRVIGETIVVLGAALVGFGVVAVGVAAFAAIAAGGTIGLVVAGIGAIVGAVTTLAIMNWDKITAAASGLWSFIKTVASVTAMIVTMPFKALGNMLGVGKSANGPGFQMAYAAPSRSTGQFDMSGLGLDLSQRSAAPTTAAANQNVTVHTTTTLDSKVLAKSVSTHQARAMGAGQTSSGRPDPNAALPAAASPYSR